jgi:MFS family permease
MRIDGPFEPPAIRGGGATGESMAGFITQRYPALGFRLFRRYWLASFASVGATQLITLGQGWLIFKLTGSALQLGVLGAAAALPNIAMTLAGGVIADRFDKRRIMICTSLSISLLLALLAWLDFSGQVLVWHVLAIAATVSLITGLDWPARVSVYPLLVDRPAFMSAVALNAFIWQATRMAVPAAGGLIIAATDTWVVFALGAAGFLVMFAVVTSIPLRQLPPPDGSPWQQIREGVEFIWREELFRWLLLLTFVGMFFGQSFNQILPVFADLLESGETGYGYLLSAGGVGSVVGTLLIGGVHRYRRLGALMLGASGAAALLIMLFAAVALRGWFLPALAVAFAAAIFASVFMISSMTVLQLSVPDGLRGRVMGIHSMGFSLMPLGGLLLGSLADRLGASPAVWCATGVNLAFVLWVWAGRPLIRRLNGRTLGG